MNKRVRVITSPSVAPVFNERGVIRQVSAAGAPPPPPPLSTPLGRDSTPALASGGQNGTADDQWEQEVRRRETAAGLPQTTAAVSAGAILARDLAAGRGPTEITRRPQANMEPSMAPDFSALPARFTLLVERKDNGWWKVTAPEVHTGLFVSDQDLLQALETAPISLNQIIQIDGARPESRRKKPRAS